MATVRIAVFMAVVSLATACKDKKSSSPAAPAAPCDTTKDPNCKQTSSGATAGGSAALVDVCSGVSSNGATGEFAALTTLICAQGTSGLQAMVADIRYAGNGTPNVKEISSEELTGNRSRMRLLASMRVNTKPQSYFNLMKLQITQPTKFKDLGFETDAKVTYEVKVAQGDTASYKYKNESEAPEVVVNYTANARFVTLVPDKLFMVATTLDTGVTNETVVALRGYSLIFASSDTSTDVVSISDQTYENNGNHATTITKAKRAATTEQARSWRNGQNADKANVALKLSGDDGAE